MHELPNLEEQPSSPQLPVSAVVVAIVHRHDPLQDNVDRNKLQSIASVVATGLQVSLDANHKSFKTCSIIACGRLAVAVTAGIERPNAGALGFTGSLFHKECTRLRLGCSLRACATVGVAPVGTIINTVRCARALIVVEVIAGEVIAEHTTCLVGARILEVTELVAGR